MNSKTELIQAVEDKVVDAPLFPGYLFCRLNIQHRSRSS